ncbi:uncharacterized protein [Amphiura filiformis]|uniref:uncharacterized protein n=1 Tax=Amphiura filiformis TaxID=82378 RepID=UPI003B21D541
MINYGLQEAYIIDKLGIKLHKYNDLEIGEIHMNLWCTLEKEDLAADDNDIPIVTTGFRSTTRVYLQGTDPDEFYQITTGQILENLNKYQANGSGWTFVRIEKLEIHMEKYQPMHGGTYILTPKFLVNKKVIINPRNHDDQCFKYSITRAIHLVNKNSERITKQLEEQSKELNWDGISFPTPISDVSMFEKNNPTISVNVGMYVPKGTDRDTKYGPAIVPLVTSKNLGRPQKVDLLLITGTNSKGEETSHYTVVKNMGGLLKGITTKKNMHYEHCRNCYAGFAPEALRSHEETCHSHEALRAKMPKETKNGEAPTQSLRNQFKSQRFPIAFYADFESFTVPIQTCEPEFFRKTSKYQKHEPSGFCIHVKCLDDSVYSHEPIVYTKQSKNEDVSLVFVNMIEKLTREIHNKLYKRENNPYILAENMIISSEEQKMYERATSCHICKKPLTPKDKNNRTVRDHCHFTGKFRGAAHNQCNLSYRMPSFFPVFFHNLSGYDAHLFIKNLGKTKGKIDCIPTTEEKYISFSKTIPVGSFVPYRKSIVARPNEVCHICEEPLKPKDKVVADVSYPKKESLGPAHQKCIEPVEVKHEIRFLDSFKFLSTGLDTLVKNLSDFPEIAKFFKGEKLQLVLRKGVYPYDYVNSFEKLRETSLPPKEAFYSKLYDVEISDDDYQHAQKVWNTFGMKTLREYHDLYLMTDVLLLADVFENFRKNSLKNNELDPCWYYTTPGISYDAMLKTTGVRLELFTDYDKTLFFEKNKKGGISLIPTRHAKANNKYMGADYDPSKPTKYLVYVDSNNLYGWAMMQPLPVGGFEWMTPSELDNWRKIPCTIEVDLEYSKELHDLHNELPLAPERMIVNKVEKLIPNLNDKKKYVVHHVALKQYEELGLIVTKVHRGVKYREKPFMKSYIDKNTSLRTKAESEFEKDFFKLMNNSVFGKTIENPRLYVDFHLVSTRAEARKLIAKPTFDRSTSFDENLIGILMRKNSVYFNKPLYLGASILDISKTKMYDFHYNYIKKKYGDKAKLCMTDTDSLLYEIETEDFYEDIAPDVDRYFDTSNYPTDHPSGIPIGKNEKVPGKFKDEAGGKQIVEYVGLRPKLYAFRIHEGNEEKKCKGIKKAVVERSIAFDNYKQCVMDKKPQKRKMNVIRSYNHEIYTETVNKIALDANDDKRVIRKDGIHTYAIGHYAVKLE